MLRDKRNLQAGKGKVGLKPKGGVTLHAKEKLRRRQRPGHLLLVLAYCLILFIF